MTNLSDTTVSISSIIQILSPVAVAVIGGSGWIIKRVVGKLEDSVEKLAASVEDMNTKCIKTERALRVDRENAFRELDHKLADLRTSCELCRKDRRDDHEDCVDTYGKFGARVTKLETEHAMHHRGAACPPIV